MCGIAGIVAVGSAARRRARARSRSMRDVITHRGPDEAGTLLRRAGGPRPSPPEHRRPRLGPAAARQRRRLVQVVFNGEIYNHAEIRPELEAHGHDYRTRCDTETIVHAYEQWGDACVERFRGMFAFAIWDAQRQRLLLARDRMGIKPLYWTWSRNRLLFGSEIKAILESGLVARGGERPRDPGAPQHALPVGRRNAVQGHPSAAARARARVRARRGDDAAVVGRAGRASATPTIEGLSDAEARRAVPREARRRGPDAADGRRAARHVPLRRPRQQRHRGADGRHDRPAAADLLGRVQAARLQRARLRAPGGDRDQGGRARDRRSTSTDFFGALPRLVWHEDEPIAHPSSVPLYFVSKLAGEHVKVVLTGEGSDELLAGYGKYPRALANWRAGAFWDLAPEPIRQFVTDTVVPRLPGTRRPLREALVPGDAADAGGDVLRQLRGDRPAAARRRCSIRASRGSPRQTPTPPRAPTSTRRTGRARCSTGCSTPTSRRTWWNC